MAEEMKPKQMQKQMPGEHDRAVHAMMHQMGCCCASCGGDSDSDGDTPSRDTDKDGN